MIFKGLNGVDASVDVFASMPNDNTSPWSLQVDASAVTGGTPSYTILVSNKSALVGDMVALRPAMSNVSLADVVSDVFLAFKWVGIQYTANGAAGTVTFYFNQSAEKTVLY